MIVFGEVGLAGEVRSVSMAQSRVNEAAKLGFKKCVLPRACMKGLKAPQDMQLIPVGGIGQLQQLLS
jgi:DNA repair protein RadA/Sms